MTGQDLLDLLDARLLGYANSLTTEDKMSFLNEGKDEIWVILKNLEDEFFVVASQYTDSQQLGYFGPMTTASRDYPLPSDFRHIQLIECITAGYERLKFTYRRLNDIDFVNARKAANVSGTLGSNVGEYYYTIKGQNTMMLAQFPQTTLQCIVHYVRFLPEFEAADSVDEIIRPYAKKIASYAAKRVALANSDTNLWTTWRSEWIEDVKTIALGADGPNEADPEFVEDFEG